METTGRKLFLIKDLDLPGPQGLLVCYQPGDEQGVVPLFFDLVYDIEEQYSGIIFRGDLGRSNWLPHQEDQLQEVNFVLVLVGPNAPPYWLNADNAAFLAWHAEQGHAIVPCALPGQAPVTPLPPFFKRKRYIDLNKEVRNPSDVILEVFLQTIRRSYLLPRADGSHLGRPLWLHLKNIGPYEDIKFDFTESGQPAGITTIEAENSTGKTIALQALALLLGGEDALCTNFDKPQRWLKQGNKRGSISVQLFGDDKPCHLVIEENQTISKFLKQYGETVTPMLTKAETLVLGYGPCRYRLPHGATTDYIPAKTHPSLPTRSLFSPVTPLVPLSILTRDPNLMEHLVKPVLEIISNYGPKVYYEGQNEFGNIMVKIKNVRQEFSAIGDGLLGFGSLLGDITWRIRIVKPWCTEPLKEAGTLLLDDLALHLHYKWQSIIVDALREAMPSIQVIGTCYSAITNGHLNLKDLGTD